MSRPILFPITFVPQKLRFVGQYEKCCPAHKIVSPKSKFVPPNLVPKFVPANFYNNMEHKTTIGQIYSLKTVGN